MIQKNNGVLDKIPEHLREKIPVEKIQKIQENEALRAAIFELADVVDFLKQEVEELHGLGNRNKSEQVWRRSVYRAVFSWIEGVVYQMKQVALRTQGGLHQAKFSRAEIFFLQEETYYLKDNGKVNTRNNNFVEIGKNLRFVYSQLVKGFKLQTEIEVDQYGGWQQFKTAKEVRNRLMHPKNAADLIVSDADMESLLATKNWFDEQISKLLTEMMATVEPAIQRAIAKEQATLRQIIDNAMTSLNRAADVEYAILILDELVREKSVTKDDEQKIKEAISKLEEVKKAIVNDLASI
jgi:hypothetical protein